MRACTDEAERELDRAAVAVAALAPAATTRTDFSCAVTSAGHEIRLRVRAREPLKLERQIVDVLLSSGWKRGQKPSMFVGVRDPSLFASVDQTPGSPIVVVWFAELKTS